MLINFAVLFKYIFEARQLNNKFTEIFSEEKRSCPRLDEILLRKLKGQYRYILPAHGAGHIINLLTKKSQNTISSRVYIYLVISRASRIKALFVIA